MSNLLDMAVDAHGGVNRWSEVASVKIDVSITGAIWYVKGQPDVLKDIVMVADTARERVATTFVGQDRASVFEPDRVVLTTADGTVTETREDPEESFAGQTADSSWDAVQVACFSGERSGRISTRRFCTPRSGLSARRSPQSRLRARRGGGSR